MEEEITTLAKTRKIGGSLVVTIPAIIARSENLQEDDLIEIKIRKQRKDYFGALKGIGSFTRKDRMEDRI